MSRLPDFVAPRTDGTLARYRWKAISGVLYAVDQERSEDVLAKHPGVPPPTRVAHRFWSVVPALVLIGGLVALVWLPWYTPVIGFFLAYGLLRAMKAVAANWVADLSERDPGFLAQMLQLAVIREKSAFQPANERPWPP